jgi:WD40 repeat protein
MCFDKEDLYDKAGWDGAAGTSRNKLLEQLQGTLRGRYRGSSNLAAFISPKVMVPQKRLATLLDQARRYQAQSCVYHQITDTPQSLYTDHACRAGSFPTVTTHVLAAHTDEVWRIEWSPDGSMLASAGKDKQVVIWLLEVSHSSDRHGVGD